MIPFPYARIRCSVCDRENQIDKNTREYLQLRRTHSFSKEDGANEYLQVDREGANDTTGKSKPRGESVGCGAMPGVVVRFGGSSSSTSAPSPTVQAFGYDAGRCDAACTAPSPNPCMTPLCATYQSVSPHCITPWNGRQCAPSPCNTVPCTTPPRMTAPCVNYVSMPPSSMAYASTYLGESLAATPFLGGSRGDVRDTVQNGALPSIAAPSLAAPSPIAHICHCPAKKSVSFWCDTCKKLLCDECAVMESTAKQHFVLPMRTALSRAQPDIDKFMSLLRAARDEILSEKENVNAIDRRNAARLQSSRDKLREAMAEAYEKLLALDSALSNELDEAAKLTAGVLKKYRHELDAKLDRVTQETSYITDAMEKNDDATVLQQCSELEWKACRLREEAPVLRHIPEDAMQHKTLLIRFGEDVICECPILVLQNKDHRKSGAGSSMTRSVAYDMASTNIGLRQASRSSFEAPPQHTVTVSPANFGAGSALRDTSWPTQLPWSPRSDGHDKLGGHSMRDELDDATSPMTSPITMIPAVKSPRNSQGDDESEMCLSLGEASPAASAVRLPGEVPESGASPMRDVSSAFAESQGDDEHPAASSTDSQEEGAWHFRNFGAVRVAQSPSAQSREPKDSVRISGNSQSLESSDPVGTRISKKSLVSEDSVRESGTNAGATQHENPLPTSRISKQLLALRAQVRASTKSTQQLAASDATRASKKSTQTLVSAASTCASEKSAQSLVSVATRLSGTSVASYFPEEPVRASEITHRTQQPQDAPQSPMAGMSKKPRALTGGSEQRIERTGSGSFLCKKVMPSGAVMYV